MSSNDDVWKAIDDDIKAHKIMMSGKIERDPLPEELHRQMDAIKAAIEQDRLRVSRNQNIFFSATSALSAVVLTFLDLGPAFKDALYCMRMICWAMSIFSAVIAVMLTNRIKS